MKRHKTLKILMVGLELNPPWVEGVRNSVRLLSLNLIERGYQVYAMTKGSNKQPDIELIEGMRYHRVSCGHSNNPLSGIFIFSIKLPLKLIKIVKQEKIDIIHTHSVYPVFGFIPGIISKVTRVKSVFTLYSTLDNQGNFIGYPKLMKILNFSKNKWIMKIVLSLTDMIVVTSNTTKASLSRSDISESKIRKISVGIDPIVFRPSVDSDKLKSQLSLPQDKRIILFAGDLTAWKGLDVFLKSISIVCKIHADILGIVMTEGVYYKYEIERKEQIDRLVEIYDIKQFIRIIGQHENIQQIYGISDVVTLPFISMVSLMDTPLALLEALSVGKPVVATDVGAFNEVISRSEGGLLVSPNDENELADAIIKLLSDDNLCRCIGGKGRQYIETFHDIHVVSKSIERLYSELLNRGTKEWKR